MKDTIEDLRKKIGSAGELGSVVRTMKALAASSITQYQRAVQSLSSYYRTVEWGLVVALGKRRTTENQQLVPGPGRRTDSSAIIVFGSDIGLVGGFNETLGAYAQPFLEGIPGDKKIWCVGERISRILEESGWEVSSTLEVPASVRNITSLVGEILGEILALLESGVVARIFTIHNHPDNSGVTFGPLDQCILPLDELWARQLTKLRWPTHYLPELPGDPELILEALVREYLFVSLYRICAESLASENASRLAAMLRAEKNIRERLDSLQLTFHRLRQESIDEELFDIVSGSELLGQQDKY